MTTESTAVSLARIEERIISANTKADDRHQAVMDVLTPLVERVGKHHVALELLRSDKKWIYGIACLVGAGLWEVAKPAVKYILNLNM
jgi:hypothetical protein